MDRTGKRGTRITTDGVRSWRRLLPLLAVSALLAACGGDRSVPGGAGGDTTSQPPPAVSAPSPSGAPADDAWQQCTLAAARADVAYPAGWFTNDGRVLPECMLFHPSPITVPEASEIPEDIAVVLYVEGVPYEEVAGALFGLRVLSEETVRVAGRPGVRRLVEHTGDGLYDAGLRTWQYIIDWAPGQTFLAHSNDAGDPPFDEKRLVLDAMMEQLQAP